MNGNGFRALNAVCIVGSYEVAIIAFGDARVLRNVSYDNHVQVVGNNGGGILNGCSSLSAAIIPSRETISVFIKRNQPFLG